MRHRITGFNDQKLEDLKKCRAFKIKEKLPALKREHPALQTIPTFVY
jgi:hypothetical protein